MGETKLLGTGYPWEVLVHNHSNGENKQFYVDEDTARSIKAELKKPDIRFIEIAGDMFFWSDVKSVERVKVAKWLDELLFKS